MKLSIVVPAHNEEKRIGEMLDEFLPFFSERFGSDVEFLVYINGTTDRTEDVVKGYMDRYPCLRCMVEPKNIGKGGAVLRGFNKTSGDLVGFVDADGATPPIAFLHLVEQLDDYDAIIASRWCKGAQVSPKQPLKRRIASRAFNTITRVFFGLKLTDTQCGAKLMRREAIVHIMPHLGLTQWAFDVDMLYHLRTEGFRIKEIPTIWQDVEGSKIEVARVSFEMFLALVRLRMLHSPFKGLIKYFNPRWVPFIHRHDEEW